MFISSPFGNSLPVEQNIARHSSMAGNTLSRLPCSSGFSAATLATAFLAAARVLRATAGAGSALAGPATAGFRGILRR